MANDIVLPFENREEGARQLLSKLQDLKGQNPLVLGVPRGAIPMAKIIADGLGGELDMILVKKVGHPLEPEFALGAVTEDGEIILGKGAKELGITNEEIEDAALKQVEALRKKRERFCAVRARSSQSWVEFKSTKCTGFGLSS